MGGTASHVANDEDRRRHRPGAVQRKSRPCALGGREGKPPDAARERDAEPQEARGRRQPVAHDELARASRDPRRTRDGRRDASWISTRPSSALDRSGRVGAAAPDGGAAAQLPDQRAPLQDQQDCDAEWMKQGARPALPEPEHERYARAVDARAGHRGCRDRRPRARRERYKKHKERQDVPAAEQQGPDRERQRLRHAFGGILRKALPDLPSAPIHPAAGEIGRVEQIGRAARPPEGSRQHEPVVPRAPDRGVTASPLIRVAAHRDQLAAARRERRVSAAAAQARSAGSRAGARGSAARSAPRRQCPGLPPAESRSPDPAPSARAGRRCGRGHRARGAHRRRRTPAAGGARGRRGRGMRAACRTNQVAAVARRGAAGAHRPACVPPRWLRCDRSSRRPAPRPRARPPRSRARRRARHRCWPLRCAPGSAAKRLAADRARAAVAPGRRQG